MRVRGDDVRVNGGVRRMRVRRNEVRVNESESGDGTEGGALVIEGD